MHGVLWPIIQKMVDGAVEEKWDEFLDAAVFAINARTHTVTGHSPFFLLYGMEPRLPGDITPPYAFEFSDADDRFLFLQRELIQLGQARAAALLRSEKQVETMRHRQNTSVRVQPSILNVGEFVKYKDQAKNKCDPVFKGPFIVYGVGPHDTYYLKTVSGTELKHPVNRMYLEPYTTLQDYAEKTHLISPNAQPRVEP